MTHRSYRVLVSTDLGGDPDDIQALIHLLHFSDILRLEGLISSPGPDSVNEVEEIREWVKRTGLDELRAQGHEELMEEASVLSVTCQGATTPGGPGPGRETPGSHWIVERALAQDYLRRDRPLWILVWGALTDLAQAMYDEPSIAERVRLYSIASSNTAADEASRDYVYRVMKESAPEMFWIENGILPRFSHDTFRGVYLGGNQEGEWGNRAFVEQNIRRRGVPVKFRRRTGDLMPWSRHPGTEEDILKEGDAASFLYLLSPILGGVGDVEDPTQESWGGRFRRPEPGAHPNYYVDLDVAAEVCQATINKWRVDFLSAWKERWGWYES
jgi:hypothetical protein